MDSVFFKIFLNVGASLVHSPLELLLTPQINVWVLIRPLQNLKFLQWSRLFAWIYCETFHLQTQGIELKYDLYLKAFQIASLQKKGYPTERCCHCHVSVVATLLHEESLVLLYLQQDDAYFLQICCGESAAIFCWASSIRSRDLERLIKRSGSVLGTSLEPLEMMVERINKMGKKMKTPSIIFTMILFHNNSIFSQRLNENRFNRVLQRILSTRVYLDYLS